MTRKLPIVLLLLAVFLAGWQPWLHAAYIPATQISGEVFAFAGPACPAGTLPAQGQTLSTTTYPNLFAAIAYTWGGSGATFQAPDARGYFLRGLDNGAGRDLGRVMASSQADAIKSFSLDANHAVFAADGGVVPLLGGGGSNLYRGLVSSSLTYTGDSETRPINLAILYCITQ